MDSNIIELVKLGHERANELKASCGAVDVRSVAQLISDLASQLEVQYVRAEESQREFRSADITMQNLEAKCAALAAENAGLKVGRKFFMYSDDSGFETYKTQEEAIKAAQEMIDACREDAYDGWPEEADTIRWGVVIQQATETDFKKPASDNGWEGSSDYKLLPETQETPATEAFLAEVRAQGVEMFAEHCQKRHGEMMKSEPNEAESNQAITATRRAGEFALYFAAHLRKGVQS